MDERDFDIEIYWALMDHFKYSVGDIDSYDELTEKEKNIISEDAFNKLSKLIKHE